MFRAASIIARQSRSFPVRGLEEFLVSPSATNGAGRSWRINELRIKSFEDLHKLWFVCLKERNYLETIRHECRAKHVQMPNFARLRKVKLTMNYIQRVLTERRIAREAISQEVDEEKQKESSQTQ